MSHQPNTSNSKQLNERFYAFKFTLSDYLYQRNKSFYDRVFNPDTNTKCTYSVWREELSFKGFLHRQMFVKVRDRMSVNAFKEFYRIKWAEGVERADYEAAIRYVKKTDPDGHEEAIERGRINMNVTDLDDEQLPLLGNGDGHDHEEHESVMSAGELGVCRIGQKVNRAELLKEIFNEPNTDKAMNLLYDKDICYYVSNYKNIKNAHICRKHKPEGAEFKQFKVPKFNFKNEKKFTLVIIGKTSCGKTQYALSHFKNPVSQFSYNYVY